LNPKYWIVLGALVGCLGVGAGAFGAHAMKDGRMEEAFYGGTDDKSQFVALKEYKRRMEIFETSVRYQMYHALAIVLAGVIGVALREDSIAPNVAGYCFTVGILFFCGPLYGLVFLMDFNWLGAIAPIGGVCFMMGWLALAVAGFSFASDETSRVTETPPGTTVAA